MTACRWRLQILRATLLYVGLMLTLSSAAARMEVLRWKSRVLENNPLHDPATRFVAVFLPDQAADGRRLPLVYYLPGYGGSPDSFITHSNTWLKWVQQLADEVTPMALVVVDGRTRWGGSQFLNSAAQGNYEDYVCDEIVPVVESHFAAATNDIRRVIAGHSSGGFGALRLGIAQKNLFDAVIALSPDSDFPVTHLPLVKIAVVSNTPVTDIERMESGKLPPPKNGDLRYILGLSAAYAPHRFWNRGQFEWIYDRHGKFRKSVWRRWMDNDPLTIVKANPHAFASSQSVYLDGAAKDEYSANVGARKIYEVLRERPVRCTFFEPPGHHSDHIAERLQRGLTWVFQSPIR